MRSSTFGVLATLVAGGALASLTFASACSDDASSPPLPDASATGEDVAAPIDASPPPSDGGGCAEDLASDGLARHLSCAGLYADVAAKTLADGVRPYTPGAQFWSDEATKARFVHLPEGSVIDATAMDDWKLPAGTKLWKELSLDGKRIETRLYTKQGDGAWRHTTYLWNADETEAERLDRGESVPRPNGIDYDVPGLGQCTSCHKGRTEPIVGFDAVGLGLPGAEGVTLATLVAEGRIVPAPAVTSFSVPEDETGKAAPALTWLHANCGGCHQRSDKAEGYGTGAFFRLRAADLGPEGVASASELDAVTTTCGRSSGKATPDGGTPLQRLAPGDPEGSAVYVLAASRAAPGIFPGPNDQMPPLVTHLVDLGGVALLREWIGAMTTCP